jgi:hypothetical protein
VDTVFGLFGLVVFAACIIALAAITTWIVVRLSPGGQPQQQQQKPQ